MNNALDSVLPITDSLDLADRAKLAERLLISLDEPAEADIERLWLDEAKRRLAAYRAGVVDAIPGDEVFRRAIAGLS